MGAFMGFADFDCNQELWNGLLRAGDYGMSKYFSKMLSLEDLYQNEKSSFSKYKTGILYWDFYKDPFLNYSKNEDVYKDRWLKMWEQPSAEQKKGKNWTPPTEEECRRVFEHFKNSIPREEDAATPEEREWLVPAAKMVYYYLVEIEKCLDQCPNGDPKGKSRCLAAGVYTLSAFFMQNNALCDSYYIPAFCCPPAVFNPVSEETMTMLIKKSEEELPQRKLKATAAVIPPNTELHSPEGEAADTASQKPSGASDIDAALQTHCQICSGDEDFECYDGMGKWCARGLWTYYTCKFLGKAIGVLFILVVANIVAIGNAPAYHKWLGDLLMGFVPRFYAGFSDVTDFFTDFAASCAFACLLCFVLARICRVYKASIRLLEEERGFRWIRYKCSRCGSKYMRKVRLDQVTDSEESYFLEEASFCFVVFIILCSMVSLVFILPEMLPTAAYPLIPFLVMVLPVLFTSGLVCYKLYQQLTQIELDLTISEMRKKYREMLMGADEPDEELVETEESKDNASHKI